MNSLKFSGEDLKTLVLAEMLNRGISQEQIKRAKKIRFPKEPDILGTSMKVEKNIAEKALTAILYLAPATESIPYGGKNLCPFASASCIKTCLGVNCMRLVMNTGHNSKLWKTLLFTYRPDIFVAMLKRELRNLSIRASRGNLQASCRLNGTSDVAWEILFPDIFAEFPEIVFYDYTKSIVRMTRFLKGEFPSNYYLTFSRTEHNESDCVNVLHCGGNVAVPFENLAMAMESGFLGHTVIDSDHTDYRPSDPRGVICGLSVKGNAVNDGSGFIVDNGVRPKKSRKSHRDNVAYDGN